MGMRSLARQLVVAIGILALLVGVTAVVFPSVVASAIAPVFVESAAVKECKAPHPPTPTSPLTDSAHQSVQAALQAHIEVLNEGDHFDPHLAREERRLVDSDGDNSRAHGRLIPVKGSCQYTQAEMATGQIVAKLQVRAGEGEAWEYAANVNFKAGEYYILVDYNTSTPTRWRLSIVDGQGSTLHQNESMVYKSTFRIGENHSHIFSPDVGRNCVRKNLHACMADPWKVPPRELPVDKASQIWVACTQTGCCCSGSGCH